MALVRWRNRGELAPWSALGELEREINRVFRGFGGVPDLVDRDWMPAIDLRETDSAYIVEAEVPGLAKEEIELVIVDNVVTLKGERKKEHKVDEDGYHRFERRYGSFQRSFEVPGGFDNDKVDAKLEDGVLRVTLPKREEAKRKQIEVKVK